VAIIPDNADDGLAFAPQKAQLENTGIYDWLGFEGYRHIIEFLDWALQDDDITIDAMAYDLNEPDIVDRLEQLGPRLRIIIDDSISTPKNKPPTGHGLPDSVETQAAAKLEGTAGVGHMHRGHFTSSGLQHNKVFIAKRSDTAVRVLGGSTNFSYRGFFIQANNVFVFENEGIAGLFAEMFERAFTDMSGFKATDLAKDWHQVTTPGQPSVELCFSPHKSADVSLGRVGNDIDHAASSVFYAIAFLNQIKSGPLKKAIDDLVASTKFSYGIVDKAGTLDLVKPSGEVGVVDFDFLADNAPEPFKSEWSGGQGINVHDKFVVIDFDQPDAKVYTGSSNFSPSGETGNGDHMVLINDQRVAVAYAIEALRIFDHLAFRDRVRTEKHDDPDKLMLKKPRKFSGEDEAWFDKYYVAGTQRDTDRLTFSRPPNV
jgi:phosphatidylserine/phosphatidylglycerophosphate/cardiolipin synthase-like enzyme